MSPEKAKQKSAMKISTTGNASKGFTKEKLATLPDRG